MQTWNLMEVEAPGGSRSPVVVHTEDEARVVLIRLDPGQRLGDHQVHERAWIVVLEGSVRIESGGESVEGGPGLLAHFAERERHAVSSEEGARILILLAPWPGEGHFRPGEAPAA